MSSVRSDCEFDYNQAKKRKEKKAEQGLIQNARTAVHLTPGLVFLRTCPPTTTPPRRPRPHSLKQRDGLSVNYCLNFHYGTTLGRRTRNGTRQPSLSPFTPGMRCDAHTYAYRGKQNHLYVV